MLIKTIAFCVLAVPHEKSIGTVRFFLYFIITTLLCNLIFNIEILLLIKLYTKLGTIPFYGLTSFLMVEIVIEANKSPEENKQYLMMPYGCKSKYYPFVVFLLLTFFTGFDVFPLIAGMIVGYLHVWGLITKCYDFKATCIERAETNWFFGLMKKVGGFYSARMADEYVYSDGDRLPVCDRNESISQIISHHSERNEPFKGQGIRVSDEEIKLSEAIRKAEGRKPISRLVQEHDNKPTDASPTNLVYSYSKGLD